MERAVLKRAFLKHPLTILTGVALGIVLGFCNAPLSARLGVENFAALIAVPGQLYLFYLQMTVIPIIITAIASSLGKLMRSRGSGGLIKKFAAVFVLCIMVIALAGMIVGAAGKPGAAMNEGTRSLLSKLITSQNNSGANGILEISLRSGQQTNLPAQGPSLSNFFRDLIPSNIFHALTMGSTMAIVFFSIIFGVAVGILKEESANLLISLLSAIFEAFQKIINWSLYLLPFGLICLMSAQIAAMGPQIFMAMSKFIILYALGAAGVFVLATIVIWARSGIANPVRVIGMLFEPILLAFATQNSMATLPCAITSLEKKMGFNSNAVNLTLPLGMTLGRFGNIFYFAVATFFVAQLYNIHLSFIHYLIIFIGVIFSGTATAGATGIVTLSTISIVLNPLGLPVEAVLVVFMAIDPIIDPFRTFLIVYVNMAATSLVVKRDKMPVPDEDEAIQKRPRAKPLTVCVSGGRRLRGRETVVLKEIARRMKRELVIKNTAGLGFEEEKQLQKKVDLLAGQIIKDGKAPFGFTFSKSWAVVNEHGAKKEVCFLFPAGSSSAFLIDGLLEMFKKKKRGLRAWQQKRA